MPLHIGDERLLGGLDLTATLQAGRPVAQRGLLAAPTAACCWPPWPSGCRRPPRRAWRP
jgi:hypothetical protein